MLKENNNKAILAIQDLIIRARNLAYQNHSHKDLAEFLDALEYLPGLMLENMDNSDLFEKFLEDLCSRYNYPEIINKYKGLG
jgi:hypothetical protein